MYSFVLLQFSRLLCELAKELPLLKNARKPARELWEARKPPSPLAHISYCWHIALSYGALLLLLALHPVMQKFRAILINKLLSSILV